MNIQIFGTRKCQDTRKAQRFFKERGVRFHDVDLGEKGMSSGELKKVASQVGGLDSLLDKEGKRYLDKGMKYSSFSPSGLEKLLVDDPLLLKTPIVRNGALATVGYCPDVWTKWFEA